MHNSVMRKCEVNDVGNLKERDGEIKCPLQTKCMSPVSPVFHTIETVVIIWEQQGNYRRTLPTVVLYFIHQKERAESGTLGSSS